VSNDDGGPHGYKTIESFNVASVCRGRGYRHGHLSTRRRTSLSGHGPDSRTADVLEKCPLTSEKAPPSASTQQLLMTPSVSEIGTRRFARQMRRPRSRGRQFGLLDTSAVFRGLHGLQELAKRAGFDRVPTSLLLHRARQLKQRIDVRGCMPPRVLGHAAFPKRECD
jgi:hypothetical protein